MLLVPVTVVSAEQISKKGQAEMEQASPQQSVMDQSQVGKAQTQSGLEKFEINQQPTSPKEKQIATGIRTPKGEREAFIGKEKVSPMEQVTPPKKAKAGMELTSSDAESLRKVTKSGQLYFRCIWVKMSN
jgi:hypothetical protein